MRRIIAAVIVVIFAFPSLAAVAPAVHADDLSDANAQFAALQRRINWEKARLWQLQRQAGSELALVARLGGEIDQTRSQIAQTSALIATTLAQIADTQSRYQDAVLRLDQEQAQLDQRTQVMNDRIKVLYKAQSGSDWFASLVSSVSFVDFLGRLVILQDVARGDHGVVVGIRSAKQEIINQKEAISTTLAQLNDQNAQLQAQQSQFEAQRTLLAVQQQEHDAAASRYQQDAASVAAQIRQDEQSEREVAGRIAALLEEARLRGFHSDGRFLWPVGGSGNITSGYGPRVNPFNSSSWGFHYGLDIATFCGDNVKAAGAGVLHQGWDPYGYGNYAIVSHGDGYTTLYGHMSGFAVGDDSNVNAGQTIGYEGSTGGSTGCHVHFEVHVSGIDSNHGTVNPLTHLM